MGWDPQFMIDYVTSDPMMFSYASPKVMEGVLTIQANKLSTWTDDPAVAQHYEIMKKYGTVAPSNFTIVAQVVGELMEEILSRTCDNLTREGLMDAVHSLDNFQGDLSLPGNTITITPDDHVGTEVMRFLRAKTGGWQGGMGVRRRADLLPLVGGARLGRLDYPRWLLKEGAHGARAAAL